MYDRLAGSLEKTESNIMENEYTFVPEINPISDELDNRMKIMQEGKERWQTLYELG